MKNKQKILIILVLISIIIVISVLLLIRSNTENHIQNNEATEDISTLKNTEEENMQLQSNVSIKSTEEEPLEKDGIRVESIDINVYGDQLEAKTTIKNNTGKELSGMHVQVDLLNEENKLVTTVSVGKDEPIKVGEVIEETSYVMGLEEKGKISKAKIVETINSNMHDTFENDFDSMTPDELKTNKE